MEQDSIRYSFHTKQIACTRSHTRGLAGIGEGHDVHLHSLAQGRRRRESQERCVRCDAAPHGAGFNSLFVSHETNRLYTESYAGSCRCRRRTRRLPAQSCTRSTSAGVARALCTLRRGSAWRRFFFGDRPQQVESHTTGLTSTRRASPMCFRKRQLSCRAECETTCSRSSLFANARLHIDALPFCPEGRRRLQDSIRSSFHMKPVACTRSHTPGLAGVGEGHDVHLHSLAQGRRRRESQERCVRCDEAHGGGSFLGTDPSKSNRTRQVRNRREERRPCASENGSSLAARNARPLAVDRACLQTHGCISTLCRSVRKDEGDFRTQFALRFT